MEHICLDRCFPTRVPGNPKVPYNFFNGSVKILALHLFPDHRLSDRWFPDSTLIPVTYYMIPSRII